MLTSIKIQKFRSIREQTINFEKEIKGSEKNTIYTSNITAFVGRNDAGKSNVLRAMNLFFNNFTGYNEKFEFKKDYHISSELEKARARSRQAKEIVIEVIYKLPKNYRKQITDSNEEARYVVQKKIWRESGLHNTDIKYYSQKKQRTLESKNLGRLPSLLKNYYYEYIPAIKDKDFFSNLLGKMYDALSDLVKSKESEKNTFFRNKEVKNLLTFSKGIDNLTENLTKILPDLMAFLKTLLDGKHRIRTPDNIRFIFENLEIINELGISLSQRGDGIKMRQIPEILKFISICRNNTYEIKKKHYHHIWGLEEPENNLELSAHFDMRNDIKKLIEQPETLEKNIGFNRQVILTTHSPAFYHHDDQNIFSVLKTEYNDGGEENKLKEFYSEIKKIETPISNETSFDLHDSMGLMQTIAPILDREHKKLTAMKKTLNDKISILKKEVESNKKLFLLVEGVTDARIFEKILKNYDYSNSSHKFDDFRIIELGGNKEVIKAARIIPYILVSREKKVIALIDDDKNRKSCGEVDEKITAINKLPNARCFKLKAHGTIKALLVKGIRIPIVLESLYSDDFWKDCKNEGLLDERCTKEKSSFFLNHRKGAYEDFVRQEDTYDEKEIIKIKYKIIDDKKTKIVDKILSQNENNIRNILLGFTPTIEEIFNFFIYLH